MKKLIKNKLVQEAYQKLLDNHTVEESNYILLNSLAILGDKKVIVESVKEFNKVSLERINRYKYPERLSSFLTITNEKTESWKSLSFAKLAFT
jgi:hypothetical protein